jgi:hypothetical protein
MNKYGTETRLHENQLYTATLNLNGQTTIVTFTSKYNPLYSTLQLVRGDFRTLFSRFSDDDINRSIYLNSVLAIAIANPVLDLTKDIPFYVKQYVRFKTELDLMTDIIFTLSTYGGSEEKLLGDMKIMKEVKSKDLDKLLKRLEAHLAVWEIQLTGIKGTPTGAVRAGGTVFPLTARLF